MLYTQLFITLPALLSTLALTHASPLLPRASASTCTPNFQGRQQTIFVRPPITDIGVYEWTPESIFPGAHVTLQQRDVNSAFATGEFLVQFTGQPNGSFHFRLAAETNRYTALTAGAGGTLAFDILSETSIPSQEFTISCTTCPSFDGEGGTDARGCTIAHPASGTCIAGSEDGDTLYLADCGSAGVYSLWEGF
ncbi:hypothetical protein D9615_000072 [Tricholomella constricta]|uniref:Uncharacterized protein n=1 Tax=Tricholomella constricta TaxID=117010 RepID=A0A8H5HRK3_9AGAR|nr:hypothetical protein D9615_000072 [Tricholomella constricta]